MELENLSTAKPASRETLAYGSLLTLCKLHWRAKGTRLSTPTMQHCGWPEALSCPELWYLGPVPASLIGGLWGCGMWI
jgi:hypothetical protein